MRHTRSIFRARIAAPVRLLAAAGIALAACSNPLGPEVDRQSTPFYYHQGDKIYLRVEASMLTAQPETPGDTAAIRAVLTERATPPDSIRPMFTSVPNHWRVYLPRNTSARTAEEAARALRLAEGIRFASAVYGTREGSCPMYMVNRLAVQFRPGADDAAIARLNAATGVRGERRQLGGTRWYEYPARMAFTPLELAAHYHRHPLVDWADADHVNGCMRTGG